MEAERADAACFGFLRADEGAVLGATVLVGLAVLEERDDGEAVGRALALELNRREVGELEIEDVARAHEPVMAEANAEAVAQALGAVAVHGRREDLREVGEREVAVLQRACARERGVSVRRAGGKERAKRERAGRTDASVKAGLALALALVVLGEADDGSKGGRVARMRMAVHQVGLLLLVEIDDACNVGLDRLRRHGRAICERAEGEQGQDGARHRAERERGRMGRTRSVGIVGIVVVVCRPLLAVRLGMRLLGALERRERALRALLGRRPTLARRALDDLVLHEDGELLARDGVPAGDRSQPLVVRKMKARRAETHRVPSSKPFLSHQARHSA